MLKFVARAAIILIGGILMLSQALLVASSVLSGDFAWALVAMVYGIAISAMAHEAWDRTGKRL